MQGTRGPNVPGFARERAGEAVNYREKGWHKRSQRSIVLLEPDEQVVAILVECQARDERFGQRSSKGLVGGSVAPEEAGRRRPDRLAWVAE